MSSNSTGKEIHSILVDYPFDLPLFASVTLKDRWEKLLTKVDVSEKFNNKTVVSTKIAEELSSEKQKIFIIFSDWIVNDWMVEKIAESEWPSLTENEVVLFEHRDVLLPFVLAGVNTLVHLSKFTEWEGSDNLLKIKDYVSNTGGIELKIRKIDEGFSARINDEDSARDAEWGLLKFLQFRPGGLVAKYLNRPFSIRITRRILKYKFVTANFVTIVDFFIGLIGLSLFLVPNYFFAVAGAVVLHFNSIVDGIDGEIARVRHESSKFGANLDSFSDETLGALLHMAIGYHLMITGNSSWFFVMGIFTGAVSYTYAMINFHSRFKKGGIGFYYWWDLNKPVKVLSRKPSLIFYLKRLFWRESILFILMFVALFKVLDYFLIISFIPALVNSVLMFIHIFIKRAEW
ncbi:MAG TPA: CDP-alcohol phosphatidyltransferase family protein [bacterium]|nr:CDP-alcohol phosphatidyltransferase family protein [bacterium]HOG44496.1 CDP-alcohol phosphatidyltransferase family protein [bacterium]